MNTILIPIDFSDGTMPSCQYAIKLCGKEATKLILFHIYPDQLMIPDSSFPVGVDSDAFLNNEFVAELREQSNSNMKKFKHELEVFLNKKGLDNFEVVDIIVGGDPEWEIQDTIKTIEPGFIVMGTKGSGNKGFLEGSVSEKIMSKAKVPVFAIPESKGKISFKNIMYATNFSEHDLEKIKLLIHLFAQFKTRFHIVHFNISHISESDNNKMESLQNSLSKEFPSKNIVYHLFDTEDKKDSLKTFTEQNNINLITFIAHKKKHFQEPF